MGNSWQRYVALRGLVIGGVAGVGAVGGIAIARSDGGGPLWLTAALVLLAVVVGTVLGARAFARRAWPGLATLAPADRRAVVRSVAKGRSVEDARLAPAVLGLVEHSEHRLRGPQASPQRLRLLRLLFAFAAVLHAVNAFADDPSTMETVLRLGLALVFAFSALTFARYHRRAVERADRAAASARALLDRSGGAESLTAPGEGPP